MGSRSFIEVFTRGCPSCEPFVTYAHELASGGQHDVRVWDVTASGSAEECRTRMLRYGIHELPAIAIDGERLTCCE